MPDLAALAARGRVLPILLHPDGGLRRICAGLPDDPERLAADMLATMYGAPGRGLAAPQIGRLLFLDRPSGIPGHGGGALPAFTSRYGDCLLGIIEARTANCG